MLQSCCPPNSLTNGRSVLQEVASTVDGRAVFRSAVLAACLGIAAFGMATSGTYAQTPQTKVDVTTYHNDNARSGLNANETQLKPANVNVTHFGKLFTHAVDGYVYAAPLIVTNIIITQNGVHNGPHDVVYVATEHDSVYAFDANYARGPNASPLWVVSLIPKGGHTVLSSEAGTDDLVPEVGITSTPVIDKATQTMYVLAKTNEGGAYFQRLHALDITNGHEKFGGPVEIRASVPGTGDGSIIDPSGNSVVPFHPLREHNRPALLLLNGVVYIAWASHGDIGPYHGWVMSYKASTLAQIAVHNTTPNGGLGGVWMSGNGLASDGVGIYYETGNGSFDADTAGGKNYGDSFVRLNPTDLTVASFFAPFNQAALDAVDADLGSGGAILLPAAVGNQAHPNLIVGCGKEGKIYLVDRDVMGGFQANTDSQIVQSLGGLIGGTWSTPAYFNHTIYYNGAGDVLKAFQVSNAHITGPTSSSTVGLGFPGATPVVSGLGTINGVVWLLQTDGYGSGSPAILHAFDAKNVAIELYNSNQANGRDVLPPPAKFAVPTVANGKVYVGAQYVLSVFGSISSIAPYLPSGP